MTLVVEFLEAMHRPRRDRRVVPLGLRSGFGHQNNRCRCSAESDVWPEYPAEREQKRPEILGSADGRHLRSAPARVSTQGRQANAGGLKSTVHRNRLPRDIAGSVAAKEEDRFGKLVLQSIAIQRNGIMIGGTNFRRVDGFRHGCIDRSWGDRIHPDSKGSKLNRLLLGKVREPGLTGAVCSAQR